jgi:hypothetical protein
MQIRVMTCELCGRKCEYNLRKCFLPPTRCEHPYEQDYRMAKTDDERAHAEHMASLARHVCTQRRREQTNIAAAAAERQRQIAAATPAPAPTEQPTQLSLWETEK